LSAISEHAVVGDISYEESESVGVIEFEACRSIERGRREVGSCRRSIVVLSHEFIGHWIVGEVGSISIIDCHSVVA